ncbi:A24 family peptidase [Nocardia sp. NPDC051030]|uniref:A24 family peptidase n=1 Tax=Nocardia sp. NPDC051030 TaxID=3155162 RepID=UPI0034329795
MPLTALLALLTWCAVLSWIDLRSRRLPNALTLPGAAAVIGYAGALGQCRTAMLGALLLGLPYLLVHLLSPMTLGAGDVKLALGLGAATALGGAQAWVWAALGAPVLTALAGTGILLARAARPWNSRAPAPGPHVLAHGPAMCASSLVALLATR